MYFQQQQLIELIREKEIEKALDFAQTRMAERADDGDEVNVVVLLATSHYRCLHLRSQKSDLQQLVLHVQMKKDMLKEMQRKQL